MTPEQYQRVGELYHAALELEPAAREGFLNRVCGDDVTLRREVDSLLSASEKARTLLRRAGYRSRRRVGQRGDTPVTCREEPQPLPGALITRRRWDGGGISGVRHSPRAEGGDQSVAGRVHSRRGSCASL